ncbi:MAG: cytochrome c biogenesis protein ResB [Geobacteraceae bacterium]|nr:cytochrome c biogenesis protein ResB [Geobacteraceae bacterium]
MTTSKRGFMESAWDFFCSLKLSISLLIGLAATSIIGTVIPQSPPREYLESISAAKIKLYSALGFFDMYHSWWFILLLYLLTINLVACSVKRLPRIWKFISEPTLIFDDGLEKTLSLTHQFKMEGDAATLKEKMAAFLKGEFAEPVVTEVDGEYHLFAQKAPYSRLGVYVVHLSIIVIFIGALIGSFFGYKAYVQIAEGTSTSLVYKQGEERPFDLGFAVRCEKFSVSFYDTGSPKEFKSILTVLENGQPVSGYENIPIVVNSPLTYKGITFYQSSYGPAGDGAVYYFTAQNSKGGAPVQVAARKEERIPLPGGAFMRVLESTQDVRPFMPMFSGPAVRIEYLPASGEPQLVVLLRDYPDFDRQRGGELIFTYAGADEKFYTGLQVAKDPGVWVVWAGCSLMVLGIFIAFFLSHKRLWFRIANGRVTVGGTASKNQPAFQLFFDGLTEKLKKM